MWIGDQPFCILESAVSLANAPNSGDDCPSHGRVRIDDYGVAVKSSIHEGGTVADIEIEEKTRKGLPNWLLILLVITVALIVWWYVARMA